MPQRRGEGEDYLGRLIQGMDGEHIHYFPQ